MKTPKFRLPKDMKTESKTPISARVKESTKETLEKAAKKEKISIGLLVSNILDDYAAWLETRK